MSESLRQIYLPSDLCAIAEQKFARKFGSLEQFLTFVLKDLIRDDAAQMDEKEQEIIQQRLRDLGYL